jgi:hypothetical protein
MRVNGKLLKFSGPLRSLGWILGTAAITTASSGAASAQTLTTLAKFDGSGSTPAYGNLIADASGNLFGTTTYGVNGNGTVFEIVKTSSGYASTPSGSVAKILNRSTW